MNNINSLLTGTNNVHCSFVFCEFCLHTDGQKCSYSLRSQLEGQTDFTQYLILWIFREKFYIPDIMNTVTIITVVIKSVIIIIIIIITNIIMTMIMTIADIVITNSTNCNKNKIKVC